MPGKNDLAVLGIFRRVRFALVCRTDLKLFYAFRRFQTTRSDASDHVNDFVIAFPERSQQC